MGLTKEITLEQQIINNANYKQDFTINISKEKSINNRYVGSSLNFDLLTEVKSLIKQNNGLFDSVGGWLNKETNIYHLDANMNFDDINFALKFAKVNKQTAIFDKLNNSVIYLNN